MSPQKPFLDYVYLFTLALQLIAIVGIDAVPFYPQSLLQPRGSPFHFILAFRRWYITTFSDPYYDVDIPGHFFEFLVYVEVVVQFPLAIYLTRALLSEQRMSGSAELAGVVYGAVTALCTAVACNDMWYLGPEVITRDAKQTLLGLYLPYAVIPALMVFDMQKRLLARLDRSSGMKQE
ncbi:hypothetical protein FPANT_594 [Fusarium pseudoanthophilum]|uniref:Efficient mitochondria targeting-associated protein 19 n=1 Tax=Fusarium pseudoanthophilum TaxID=48495 RepID=A0A8H5Q4K2_9HYPO|nr:hypothetical protein FPANT_594 [Fusarium pseudoanthophilum]